jgi:hypothetical protein
MAGVVGVYDCTVHAFRLKERSGKLVQLYQAVCIQPGIQLQLYSCGHAFWVAASFPRAAAPRPDRSATQL